MLKEFVEKILSLATAEIIEVGGRNYSTRSLHPLTLPLPVMLEVHTLTGVKDYIMCGLDSVLNESLMAHVMDHTEVRLIGRLNTQGFQERISYIHALHDNPVFKFNQWFAVEDFIISLQSMFVQDESTAAILKIVGNLKLESGTVVKDDGISQEVTAKQGVSMVAAVKLPNPVTLRPYRTFREIEQPASTFILRMKHGNGQAPSIALFEADGRMWELEAIAKIKEWLQTNVSEELTVIA